VEILKAVLLAVVEGITEFLPISSTGHLILVGEYLSFQGGEDFAHAFHVIIQLPAILAVVVYFWKDLWPFGQPADRGRATWMLWSKIVVAFLPAAVAGVLFADIIEEKLFNSVNVAIALFLGGVVLVVIERARHEHRLTDLHDLGYGTALLIGCFQCLAMIPGTSRSAATIIGAMLLGASRSAAAEFSFFLAIPTMAGATAYTLMKHGIGFSPAQWGLLAIGSVVSFAVAYGSIAFLMGYVRRHDFRLFGYYRIVLGAAVLILFWLGWLAPAAP